MIDSEFLIEHFALFLPMVIMYAELHFRFKWSNSRYFQKEPEILADLPIRIEPGNDIPILLIIKDAHIFPIILEKVEIKIIKNNKIIQSKIFSYNADIDFSWWDDTITIDATGISGDVEINVEFSYKVNDKSRNCTIHNYPLCTHNNLTTYVSEFPYPNDGNALYGDLHYHTNLTEDKVEFGAPLKATLTAAEALGLDFYCNTDHSYDLDDVPGSWTETDPNLEKWNKSRSEINKINNDNPGKSFIIPSEELSLHNQDGRNVHALILNNSHFLPGQGDGAEEAFNFYADYNTKNVHASLDENSLCIAAHPFSPVPLVQWFFVKRGKWLLKDILENNLAGLQIVNGDIGRGYQYGIKIWIRLLLDGYHKFIYAGNDAHGNFNMYRQIKTPMLSLYEKKEQLFGEFRTGVFTKNRDINSVISSMKNGNCFVTNGPFINLTFENNGSIHEMGSIISSNLGSFKISIISTSEFGKIKDITLIKGIIKEQKENNFFTILNYGDYELEKYIEINIESECYFRCIVELESISSKKIFALTNPIWLKPKWN